MRIVFSLALSAFVCIAGKASAQSAASASCSATIITPITIGKTADMNFGNAAVQTMMGGAVVLSPAGGRTATSGVTLPALSGTVSAAQFVVTGQANYTYAITLPSSAVISDIGQVHNMVVNTFTSTPSMTGTLSPMGTQILNVGAKLNVGAGQTAGTYATASDFTVTVNYN